MFLTTYILQHLPYTYPDANILDFQILLRSL